VSAAFRLLIAFLQQPWAARIAGVVSFLLLGAGIAGALSHWPRYLTLLIWGVVWAVVALGAWTLNR